MINLLPLAVKKKVRRIYVSRLGAVSLIVAFVAMFTGSIFLLPSLFLVSIKEERLSEQISNIKNAIASKEGDIVEEAVLLTNAQLEVLVGDDDGVVSSRVHALLEQKGDTIAFTGFFYQKTTQDGNVRYKINIEGKAATRASLTALRDRLRKDETFLSVDLPVSSFVQSQDIPFSLVVTFD